MLRFLLALAALVGSIAAHAADAPLAPQDFANGMRIAGVDNTHAAWRLALPAQLYGETAWPDLRDIRVFNSEAQAVPFWLTRLEQAPAHHQRAPLTLFELPEARTRTTARSLVVQTDQRRVEVVLPDGMSEASRVYLLELNQATRPRLSSLNFTWQPTQANWRAAVTVMGSDDLRNWQHAASGMLADLAAGKDALRADSVDLACRCNWRYWMLRVDGDAPTLTTAAGVFDGERPAIDRPAVLLKAHAVSATEIEYSLPRPAEVNALRVRLAQHNAFAPMEISVRDNATAPWRRLRFTVAHRLGTPEAEQHSPDLPLGQTVQAVRLNARDAGWGRDAPLVYAVFEPREVVFNARGEGPFTLAWGARAAPAAALPAEVPIPRGEGAPPLATVAEAVTLGGPQRLDAPAPGDRASAWQRMLLWAVLIAGVVALAWLAMGLLRDARKSH
jgi:hypothetical protein